ncbi:hypothetical protein D3C78_1949980 [compost metagenome]
MPCNKMPPPTTNMAKVPKIERAFMKYGMAFKMPSPSCRRNLAPPLSPWVPCSHKPRSSALTMAATNP